MQAYRLTGAGLDALTRVEVATPAPGPGEVLVRMRAMSLNSRDLSILAGHYPNKPDLQPLSDGAGIVEAVGAGVTDVGVGDAVTSCFYADWQSGPATAANHRLSLGCERDGVLARHAVLPATAVVPMPAHLSFAEAATLPCAALTAWSALFTEGRLLPGEQVLIIGTGGVALFALQFARLMGARAIMLSGDDARLERARSLGADHGINYRTTPDWATAVQAATDGAGVDLVVELGGGGTLAQSLKCVRVGGRISLIGAIGGLEASVFVPDFLFRHIHLTGITVGHREDFRAMNAAIARHGLRPLIHARYDFDAAPAAYADMMRGGHFGKLVIETP